MVIHLMDGIMTFNKWIHLKECRLKMLQLMPIIQKKHVQIILISHIRVVKQRLLEENNSVVLLLFRFISMISWWLKLVKAHLKIAMPSRQLIYQNTLIHWALVPLKVALRLKELPVLKTSQLLKIALLKDAVA